MWSGPPTWSRRAAAGSGRRCGPRPISMPRSGRWSGFAFPPSPTVIWPTWRCTWSNGNRDSARATACGPSTATPRLTGLRDRAAQGSPGAPVGLAGPRRLVEGRARDQRDHGCRGSDDAPLPRHPRTGDRPRPRPDGSSRNQRADGTWATFFGGPGDLSTTVEAYVGPATGR